MLIAQEFTESPDNEQVKSIRAFYYDDAGDETVLPSFISFDEYTSTFKVISTANSDAGTYTLVTEVVYTSSFNTWRQCETFLEVVPFGEVITVNTKPHFSGTEDFLPLDAAICGQSRAYQLPEIEDHDEF